MRRWKTMGKYIITVFAAAYFGLLVQCLAITPLRFSGNDSLSNIVSSICCVVGSLIMLFFLTKKISYDENFTAEIKIDKFNFVQMGVAIIAYILFTIVFSYNTAATVDVVYLAQEFTHESSLVDTKTMAKEYPGVMFMFLIITVIPYIVPMVLGYFSGVRKRKKNRDMLHQNGKSKLK